MSKNILFFNNNNVSLYLISGVSKDGSVKGEKLFDETWNAVNIKDIADKVKTSYKVSKVTILLSDTLVYLASLEIDAFTTVKEERSVISSKLQSVFPENSKDLVWDYKIIKRHGEHNVYQVVGIRSEFLKMITSVFDGSGIEIDVVEPLAHAIARLTEKEEFIHFLVSYDEFGLNMVLSYKGAVIFSIFKTSSTDIVKDFSDFKKYCIEKHDVEDNTPIFSNVQIGDLQLVSMSLNALQGVFLAKKRQRGKDRDILEIPLDNKPIHEEKIDLKVKKTSGSSWDDNNEDDDLYDSLDDEPKTDVKRLIMMIAFLLLLVGLAGGLIYFRSKDKKEVKSGESIKVEKVEEVKKDEPVLPNESKAPDDIPIEVKEASVNLSDYKVLVQNGSGIAGEAGKVKTALEEQGFTNIIVENASSYEYKQTLIKFKESIPQKVFDLAKNSIITKYDVNFPTDVVPKDSEYDVVIIVGSSGFNDSVEVEE